VPGYSVSSTSDKAVFVYKPPLRAIYRTVELADGWNGKIISTQILFSTFLSRLFVNRAHGKRFFFLVVLDGAMITLAMYTMNIAHPGLLLGQVEHFKLPKTRSKGDSSSTVGRL
jgi:hypothetical protein